MQSAEELVHNGALTKVERYGWTVVDSPGRLVMLSKHVLFVEERYQRGANEAKVKSLASEWSWLACGALIVAERNGRLYVVDGQHRLLAARRRADIKEVPCIVFSTNDIKSEARAFLRANGNRKPVTSLEKFRALLETNDDNAMLVEHLLKQAGRSASTNTGAGYVRCLTLMLSLAKNNRESLVGLWPLITQLCEGRAMHERILAALVFIEERMPEGESLTDRKWASRMLDIGSEKLMEATNKAAAFYARGGARVWAAGIVELLNKGLRNRLLIRGVDE